MISLIAEAKTMRDSEISISLEDFDRHHPVGEGIADGVMADIACMSIPEIMKEVKLSGVMAGKLLRMAYEFPNKSSGLKAIEAYTGVVFKAFDFQTLSADRQDYAIQRIAIISSLYGWLRPDDYIKPYRLDYTTRIAPDGRPLADYWRKDVTINLVRHIQAHGETDILDLLPADAARSVDRKLVKRFAKIWKVDFKELTPGGAYKTPNANRLKTLRGMLLREIVKQNICDPADLLTLRTDELIPLGTPDYPDHIAFCV